MPVGHDARLVTGASALIVVTSPQVGGANCWSATTPDSSLALPSSAGLTVVT